MNTSTFESELLWLNIANIALGLWVAACAVMVVGAIILELRARQRQRAAQMAEIESALAKAGVAMDTHAFFTPGLGVTMADGGEPIKAAPKSLRRKR